MSKPDLEKVQEFVREKCGVKLIEQVYFDEFMKALSEFRCASVLMNGNGYFFEHAWDREVKQWLLEPLGIRWVFGKKKGLTRAFFDQSAPNQLALAKLLGFKEKGESDEND